MSVPTFRTHTDAVIETLETAGLTVGDADAEGLTVPYVVVYSIPGGRLFGTLDAPHDDGELVYQVSCVGSTREQAEWLVDKAMILLQGFDVGGRSVAFVTIDSNPGVRRDDDITPPVFLATPRFRITTTPGNEVSS